MKLTPDSSDGNIIQSFIPGTITLRDQTIHTNVIVSDNQLITEWAPPTLEALSIADFQPALDMNPDIILFGTGLTQRFPALTLMTEIMRTGVAIEIMQTEAACRTFNVLIGEKRAVVAALLIE
ncbi:MAG: hypothetical protein GY727_02440 [Gammaproteobacteria bacterium]|nr:hypothetical protein [Gammaproteobacteria bacterium]MCP4088815.1 hypothetical protein [Gammaproteobacteria bacterium]MCP4275886.1 hypothetical protein [Gammaproteobacteria bacterium]MCP4832102.1 hypothetical protein [Gammaproteobacteria bacterium]MCP4928297.1 hypothetical protein [Gammaproteobacteria bacterium]